MRFTGSNVAVIYVSVGVAGCVPNIRLEGSAGGWPDVARKGWHHTRFILYGCVCLGVLENVVEQCFDIKPWSGVDGPFSGHCLRRVA